MQQVNLGLILLGKRKRIAQCPSRIIGKIRRHEDALNLHHDADLLWQAHSTTGSIHKDLQGNGESGSERMDGALTLQAILGGKYFFGKRISPFLTNPHDPWETREP
jgi:hypothetical protein